MVTAKKTLATPDAGKPAAASDPQPTAAPAPKAAVKVAAKKAAPAEAKAAPKAAAKPAAATSSPSAAAAPAKVKKPKLVRDGIKALAAMEGAAFLAALNAVPAIMTGRPRKS